MEFAFMLYNQYAYTAAIPAYSTASQNAKDNHAPYGILITSTPGDLTTEQGQYAYALRNNATPWNEAYYDYSYEKLEELRLSNTKSSFFLIRYTYQQLGKGNEYFNQMCTDLGNDWPKIRREILLEWARTADNCPFRKEDLDTIQLYIREPIRTLFFGRAGQYQFNVYEDIDLRFPPIVGVDVAGAMYQDSSCITVVDSRTTRVCATLNCNYMPSDDLAEVLYSLTKNYMPNCCINIERNGGFGASVIQRLVKTDIKKNLYYEIKEKVVEESFNGYRVNKNKARVRVFGLDSTRDVRARLIEILYDRVAYHKDKFVAKILLDEMGSMEVKPSGKVEHSSTSHDDQVFSYLMALYVWYDGKNVMENFNIQKNVIKTDEDEEIVEGELEQDTSMERVPMEEINMDDDSSELDDQLDYIKEASKYKLGYMFNNELYMREQQARDLLLATNKVARQAYNEKYNVSESETGVVKTVMLPDTIFMDDEQMLLSGKVDNGNMFDIFNGL